MKATVPPPRMVMTALVAAALAGLLVGMLVGAVGRTATERPGAQAAAQRPVIPPFVPLTPTATPRPDHPSPDLGNLVGAKERGRTTILFFDRASLLRSGQGVYTVDNKAKRLRVRILAKNVKVIGAERLTRQPEPRDVPLATLLGHLRVSRPEDPLLVWLRYDASGKVVEVREQNLP